MTAKAKHTEPGVIEYPQVYKNAAGIELIARDDIQSAVFVREGFEPAGKYEE